MAFNSPYLANALSERMNASGVPNLGQLQKSTTSPVAFDDAWRSWNPASGGAMPAGLAQYLAQQANQFGGAAGGFGAMKRMALGTPLVGEGMGPFGSGFRVMPNFTNEGRQYIGNDEFGNAVYDESTPGKVGTYSFVDWDPSSADQKRMNGWYDGQQRYIFDADGNFLKAEKIGSPIGNFVDEGGLALAAIAAMTGGAALSGMGAGAGAAGSAGSGAGFVGEGAASGIGAWDGALASAPSWSGAGVAGGTGMSYGPGGWAGEAAASGSGPGWNIGQVGNVFDGGLPAGSGYGLGGGSSLSGGGAGYNVAGLGSTLAGGGGGGGVVPPNPFVSGGTPSNLGSLIKSGATSLFGGDGSFDWSKLIGPGLQVAGSTYGARQAGKAGETQAAAAREAMAMFEPWRQAGGWSIGQAATMLGKNGPEAARNAFLTSPDYEFRRSEGEKSMTRAAAASGLRGSGKFLKDYNRFNQDLASTEFDNSLNRLLGVAGMGQKATGSAADYRTQVANATAAGAVGKANALIGGFNQGLSMYSNNQQREENNALLRALLARA